MRSRKSSEKVHENRYINDKIQKQNIKYSHSKGSTKMQNGVIIIIFDPNIISTPH